MDATQLFYELPVSHLHGPGSPTIKYITDDSRRATPDALFIARSGSVSDGQLFIDDAISKGATALLIQSSNEQASGSQWPEHVSVFSADITPTLIFQILCRFHEFKPEQLKLLGITGTNGKTTTTFIVRHLLNRITQELSEDSGLNLSCGLISTVEIDDGQKVEPAELTTPGMVDMIAILARAQKNGCFAVVMECSSHALAQSRLAGLKFNAAAFTNLTGDHLDYHKTMEAYAAAKAILFSQLTEKGAAILNRDANGYETMREASLGEEVWTYGREPGNQLTWKRMETSPRGTIFSLTFQDMTYMVQLPMIGEHNIENAVAAMGMILSLEKVGIDQVIMALEDCPAAPGRLEPVLISDDQPFSVLVDYAHTDDALDNVLRALRPLAEQRLITLFGCGGDRDATKRPRMAKVACTYSDVVMITSDNPRTEDPAGILEDIKSGVPEGEDGPEVMVEIDRIKAIQQVIAMGEPGDVILLAGKGHEDYQIIGTEKIHLDDREQARLALKQLLEFDADA